LVELNEYSYYEIRCVCKSGREEDIRSSIKKTNEDIEKARTDQTLTLKLSAKFSSIRLKAIRFRDFFQIIECKFKALIFQFIQVLSFSLIE
jgi:hypothetical protein